jgi:hypothetical protein
MLLLFFTDGFSQGVFGSFHSVVQSQGDSAEYQGQSCSKKEGFAVADAFLFFVAFVFFCCVFQCHFMNDGLCLCAPCCCCFFGFFQFFDGFFFVAFFFFLGFGIIKVFHFLLIHLFI